MEKKKAIPEKAKVQKKPKAKKLGGKLQVETIQKQKLCSDELNEQFMKAVMEGKMHKLKLLLDKGADINAKSKNHDYGYNTPLVNAVENGNLKIVDFLIKHGANVDAQGNVLNALGCASWNGHKEIVELLIKNGADVNFKDGGGFTPLHDAARSEVEITKILLEHGADPNIKSTSKYTALIVAAEEGNLPVVKLLVESGADINAKNKYWNSALNRAFDKGHIETVNYLLSSGAEVDTTFRQEVLKELDIMKSKENSKVKTIQKQKALNYLLCCAAKDGNALAAEIPLNLGADPNTELHDNLLSEGVLPLPQAICEFAIKFPGEDYSGVLKVLLKYEADTKGCLASITSSAWNAKNPESNTKLFNILLDAETDVEMKNDALYIASYRGDFKKVKLLLDAGANDAVGALMQTYKHMNTSIISGDDEEAYVIATGMEKEYTKTVNLLKKTMKKNGSKFPEEIPWYMSSCPVLGID